MRKLSVLLVAVALALAWVGCDSGGSEDEATDGELFVGIWALTSISDATGDQTAGFAGLANSLTITLNADNSFTLLVDYREDSGRQDLPLAGSYEVDDGANTLILTVTALQSSLPFSYSFENDNVVSLSANAALVNPVFNPTTPYEGTVNVVIERQ